MSLFVKITSLIRTVIGIDDIFLLILLYSQKMFNEESARTQWEKNDSSQDQLKSQCNIVKGLVTGSEDNENVKVV